MNYPLQQVSFEELPVNSILAAVQQPAVLATTDGSTAAATKEKEPAAKVELGWWSGSTKQSKKPKRSVCAATAVVCDAHRNKGPAPE